MLDHLRHEKFISRTFEDPATQQDIVTYPEKDFENREFYIRYQEVLEKLPEQRRIIFILKKHE